MSDQKLLPSVLLPDVTFRNLPAPQPLGSPSWERSPLDPHSGRSENVKLRWLWQIVRKRLWLVIGIAVVATTLSTLNEFRNKPLYQATTTIEIGRESGARVRSNEVFFDDEDQLYVTMNTAEVEIKSAPLLEDVVVQLQLDKNPGFVEGTKRKSLSESLHDIAGKVRRDRAPAPPAVFTVTPIPAKISGTRSPEEVERLAPYVGIIEGGLRIRPVVDTRVMTVAYTHNDPVLAASIANAVSQRFVETSFGQKIEKYTSASEWLDRSTRELKSKVEQAEQALADYTRMNNIYGLEGKDTLVIEKLAKMHEQVTRAETDRILKESLHDQVLQGRINEIPEAFADTQTAELQKRLGELSVKSAELSVTYGPKYPQVAEISQQTAIIRDQVAASRKLLEQKLKADYERAVRDENSLKAALVAAKNEASQENQSAIKYSILKQDVETTKALYTEFLQKTSQAYLEVAQQHRNVRVIASARTPKSPVDQHRQRTILFSLVLSLAGGVGLAWLMDRLDDSIRNIDDVTRFTQLPALAVIPVIGSSNRRKRLAAANSALETTGEIPRARLMEFDSRSSAAEAYRALRTGLLLSGTGNPPKTMLVTSVRSSEGKTTTATNIAISLAQLGSSVLLIDCDLRRPAAHTAFEISHTPGLSTYLAQNVPIEELTHHPAENLHLLPAGPTPPNPAELLASEKMRRLIERLSSIYDHVVIDSPPLGSVTDPVILSTMVDGVIMVVHAGRNKRNAVQRGCHELSAVGARIFGIVLNSVNMKREGYADYQYYYYGYPSDEDHDHSNN